MKFKSLFSLFILITSCSIASEYSRPSSKFLRYQEDWSVLKDVDKDSLLAGDKIKYIELSSDGDIWVSLGGHLRARYENHDNFAFGAPLVNDDDFILYRGKFHADFHFGEKFRIFSEFKHADSTNRILPGGNRVVDVDRTEIQQLFVDYSVPLSTEDSNLTFRFGRQEYGFGRNRLVSSLPWANALRQWDGFNVNYQSSHLNITGFYSRFVPVLQYDQNRVDSDHLFQGIYATQNISSSMGFDYYWLGIERDNRAFNGTQGDEKRQTFGVRHWRKLSDSLSYEGEAAFQNGSLGDNDISAYMLASELIYKPLNMLKNPKFTIGFDYASGDKNAGGDVNTFNQMYPLGHAYFGFIDIVGRQNIVDYSGSFSFNPFKKTVFRLGLHYFNRAEKADGLYSAGAGVVREGDINASKELGTEVDLTFSYKIKKQVTTAVGFSRFNAGEFLTDTGSDETIHFGYLQILYNF